MWNPWRLGNIPYIHCPQGCTRHVRINNCSNIGQNDLISLNHTIPWIFPEFHVCHKDLYLFLSQNKLPSKRSVVKKVETLAESFVLLDSLMFKLVTTPDKETAVLAIPETCIDKIIVLYHTSLFAGQQGLIKMYLTMKDKFFIQNLMHYLRSFIKGCHICQLSRSNKPPTRQLQARIYLNYRLMSKLSMDLKVMPRSQKGHKFILCIIDEMMNYLITVPIFRSRSEEVGEALIEHVISKFCAPDCIIMDQDSAFMSTLMNYLF